LHEKLQLEAFAHFGALQATLLLWLNGRIAGISSIFGDMLDAEPAERGWRILFLFGLSFRRFCSQPSATSCPSRTCRRAGS
jgi:hypothetical protein